MSNVVCPAPPRQPVFTPWTPTIPPQKRERIEKALASPEWSAALDTLAGVIQQMTVKKAAPNATGRQIHVTVTYPTARLAYAPGTEMILPCASKEGTPVRTMELRFKGVKSRDTTAIFNEMGAQLVETRVIGERVVTAHPVTLDHHRTLRGVLASCAKRIPVPGPVPFPQHDHISEYHAGYVLLQELAKKVDVDSPGLKAVRDAFQSAGTSARKAFSKHVVTKVRGDILKLAKECFMHGAEMEDLQAILQEALVASVMDR